MREQILELVTEYQEKISILKKLKQPDSMSARDSEFNQKFHELIGAFIEEHTPAETDGKDHSMDILNILTMFQLMTTGITKEMITYITKPILGDWAAMNFTQSIVKAKYPSMGNNILHYTIARREALLKNLDKLQDILKAPMFQFEMVIQNARIEEKVNQVSMIMGIIQEIENEQKY